MFHVIYFFSFFFQAEDGIRDGHVTGVQTCALPIYVGTALSTLFGGEAVFGDDIGDPDTATRREDAEHLGKDGGLVGGEVDDAVGDHHTHRPVRKRYVLDGALEELDVLRPGLDLVLLGQGEHFVGHVHAVGEPGRSDTACGEQHIDAATGAEVEHPLTLVQLSDRRGIATARAGLDRLQWESGGGRFVVETRAEAPLGRSAARVVGRLIRSLCSGGAGTARRDRRLFDQEVSVAGAGGDRGRGLGVAGADLFAQLGVLVLAHCLLHFPRGAPTTY